MLLSAWPLLGRESSPRLEQPFDAGWLFHRGDLPGAEDAAFNDAGWRVLDVPHDWSIEDLPSATNSLPSLGGTPVGPFSLDSPGGASTGYVVGGTGWYRKHFALGAANAGQLVSVLFDGVYMDADVWLNGQHLGNHPYGYTPFAFDLTSNLRRAGETNVLAVRVRNLGKNSRWYSGSGIYRHVRLTVTGPLRVPLCIRARASPILAIFLQIACNYRTCDADFSYDETGSRRHPGPLPSGCRSCA